jgi:hypothetical protein
MKKCKDVENDITREIDFLFSVQAKLHWDVSSFEF